MTSFKTRLARKMGVNEHLGEWNAQTNTPQLTSGVGQVNGYYIVSVSGSTELDGESDWKVDDWVYFTGTAWKKIDNTDDLSGSSGNGDGATPVTYVSSIDFFTYADPRFINFLGGSPFNNIFSQIDFTTPLPLNGRLYYVTEEIFSQLTQTIVDQQSLDPISWEYVTNQATTAYFASTVEISPGAKFYLIYAPVIETSTFPTVLEKHYTEVIFPLAEITIPNDGPIDDPSLYQKNYFEVEINAISVMDELRYLYSKDLISDVSAAQDELSNEISTLSTEIASTNTQINSIQSELDNKLSKAGGILTGALETNYDIYLKDFKPSSDRAAISRKHLLEILRFNVETLRSDSISADTISTDNIRGPNWTVGADVHASELKVNVIKAPEQLGPYIDTKLVIKKANPEDPHQEMMKFFSYWGGPGSVIDFNGENATIIIRPYSRVNALYTVPPIPPDSGTTTSYNIVQINSLVSIRGPLNEYNLMKFSLYDGTNSGGIYIDFQTGDAVYSNFCGAHPSQLPSEQSIKLGSVMESLDEMCQWGAALEKRLPKTQLCLTEESSSVYGVFTGNDEDGDPMISAVGLSYCRIASNVVVKKGDLLVSNGDGCARVQSDDIIRSKTIGKVVSSTVIEVYEDGSYTVPVALYCG